jgi:hypothetical protein
MVTGVEDYLTAPKLIHYGINSGVAVPSLQATVACRNQRLYRL